MASLIFERISSSSSSSSYSFSTHGRKCDVFLSFRGEETRHGFTDHLYEELRRKRIHVFRDDEKLQRGEVVALELMKAIEESQYAIVVLSEKFADSKRCLDELAKIVECREKTGLSIFPVFDHVDPSDVHNQKGPFETVFAKHETDDSVTIEKKQKWMDALRDVSNISGWCLHDRSESTVIQNIVERMHSELYGEFESVSKDLVGMESSIEGVIDLLDKGSDDVRFIGIWGCGGVGKTTLAQVIYCKISNQFDTKSFICFGYVGQTKNDYLVPIQKLLLSNIFAKGELNITSVHEGKRVIKQMLCSRKVLIVLDNVNDKGQLDAIAESRDWFGAGSRLIITSRNKQLLTSYNVDMYEAKTLDNDKALELFSRKAFKQPHPKKDFVDLSNDFVKYAQGLPLFLEVFGSSLHKEGIEVWKIFLDQLNENSSGEIMERLEISYKRILDQKAKELFLDIAFFFKGMDKNRVANILNDPSYWENIDILKKKSLITILGRKIWMHDLLQEMGKEIVRREAPQEPGIRSRLWDHKDIFSILKNNTGTKRVEGMMLNCPPNKEDLNANCFSEMTRLRLINICNVLLPHGLNYLSNELQMMEWNDYPLKFMPRNFGPNNLVELIMHHSHIEQLPEEFTNLDQLKLMDLSYSQNLIKTPDFIGFRNLERVIFQGCTRLYKVQPSVVALRWLTLLNLKDCKHLKSLPYEIDLESLEIFILSGCSRLQKFSEIGRNMTRLSELYLDGTAIKELPPSIKHLTGLTLLNLKDCNDLLSFPRVICSLTSLEILTLSGCRGQPRKPLHLLGLSPMASSIGVNLTFKGTILVLIMSFLVLPYNYLSIFVCATLIIWTYCFLNALYPEPEPINLLLPKSFSGLSSLKSLDLSDCNLSDGALPEDLSCLSSLRFLNLGKNNFTFLPDSISQLSKLKLLCLDNCRNLQSLPYLPSSTNFVMARGCTSLENYSKKVLVWTSGETGFTFINCLSLVEEEDKITEVSLLGSLLEDEGSKRTKVSLLDLHFQPLWQRYMEDQIRESEGFCCVLPQSDITEWFKYRNCGSYVSIPLHRYNISFRGIALCVDFEVHKNSNEVSPGQDAKFICRLYMDGAPIDPIVYTVPRDKICVGSFGIWLYISHKRIREVDQCDCIRPLIRTNSADIEIKGCGARILYESDVVGFVQHLSQNIFGSPDDLRRGSEDFIKCHLGNSQSRDDKVESSQSNALIEPSPRLRSALWSLLSGLDEGDHARHHYDYIFPQIAILRDWFSYQNLESYIKMELPPNLHDNSTWMGFTIFASYTVDKQQAGWSYEQNSTIFLHFYSFSASEEVPLAPYITYPLSGDDFDESSRRLLVFYIPRAQFQLNCFSHIWASFGSNNQVVKVEMCGIRIVYEQDVEQFVQTLVQCMLEIPVAYHPSLYQNLLHQLALLQDCNHKRGFCSSFSSERRPQTMPKLLPTNEIVAEEDCTSPKNRVIAMSSGNLSPIKGTELVQGIVLDYQGTEVVEGMVLNSLLHKENLNDKAFYHVNPSDVGNQRESFEKAFLKHEEDRKVRKEQIKEWRTALKEVSKIRGRHLLDSSEAEVVQEIVQEIFNKLNYTFSVAPDGLVGIDSRAEKLKSLLAKEPNDVRIIGICGMGGMGKTTLARVVYGMISNQFEACSFIPNVREKSEKGKLLKLQQKLLEELLMGGDMKIQDVDHGVLTIKNRLHNKKILLVLDDVDKLKQLEKLAGKNDWFGPGSRVIITTRDGSLLVSHEVNEIYEIEALNNKEALQLFSLKAFKKDQPDVGYVELSQAFVDYSHGLPLALEILGSPLFKKRKDVWRSLLDKLKKYPNKEISNVLQWSYDGLEEIEKQSFLNIACFFNHKNQETIKEILEYLDLFPENGFSVLIDKSIIKVYKNHLWMHDLLQEMGRNIVLKQSPEAPGKRSRLWLCEDIDNVLTNNTGTDEVQAMVLELSFTKDVDWHPEAFSKMQNLKLLIIDSVHFKHGLKHLPNNLRFLDWKKYPSKSLPSSFESTELVKLCMNCSYIERLWKGTKSFRNLKFINLNKSLRLIETPDFSKVPVLKKLDLEDCTNLCSLHPSIGVLKELTILNLKGCKNLKNLPKSFAMESLEILTFSGCSKLRKIPEFAENMKRVSKLYLDGTAVTKLPTSIGNLTHLASLSARDCINLKSLPSSVFHMKSLQSLSLSGCTKLGEQLEKLGTAESVEELDVSGPDTRLMPSFNAVFKFFYLIFHALKLRNFYPMQMLFELNSISGLTSLTKLDLRDCNLNVVPNDIYCLSFLKKLDLSGNNFICLPNSIAQLPRLRFLWVEKCTSLRSLPKLPLNIGYINGYGCTLLETVPDDLLEPNSSVERRLYLSNCSTLANNQVFMDMFLAGIRKHNQVTLSVFHSLSVFFPSLRSKHQVLKLPGFPGDVFVYMPHIYDIIIPGSEIPEWFSHKSMGGFLEINEPSQLGNELVGIAVCVVFCSRQGTLSCWLKANGKEMSSAPGIHKIDVLSDHTWLLYLQPEFYHEKERESLRECDENGFRKISISIFGAGVKKCGLRMVYKRDIEDLNRTMSQSSNNNSTPEGSVVLNDFTVLVKNNNKPLTEGLDDFTLIVESEGFTELMTQGLEVVLSNGHLVLATTCPKLMYGREHKECRHLTSDSQESSEGLLAKRQEDKRSPLYASDFCSIQ